MHLCVHCLICLRSATPWYMTVTTIILLWISKTTMWLRRVCYMYWFCGWWPKKLVITLLKQLRAFKIVQSVIRTYYWTLPCLRFTLRSTPFTQSSSIDLPSDYLIKVWSAFLIHSCLPRVLRISSHPISSHLNLWFCHPNNICRKWSPPNNPLTASALVSDHLKVPLICVVPIVMACLLKPKHVAMVKKICRVWLLVHCLIRGVSRKQSYITYRPIGKFFMLIMATLPSILILCLWAMSVWQW
jgi:hypothetical protein